MKKISDRIIINMQKKNLIDVKLYDMDILRYGLELKLSKIFHICIMLLISIVYYKIFDGIFFIIVYSKLRQCAGGFHAKSEKGCWFVSIAVMNCAMIGLKLMVNFNFITCLIPLAIFSFVIIRLSPVDCYNKPIDSEDIISYKYKTIKVVCILDICCFALGFLKSSLYLSIVIAFFIQIITMILGCLDSPRYKGNRL